MEPAELLIIIEYEFVLWVRLLDYKCLLVFGNYGHYTLNVMYKCICPIRNIRSFVVTHTQAI